MVQLMHKNRLSESKFGKPIDSPSSQ